MALFKICEGWFRMLPLGITVEGLEVRVQSIRSRVQSSGFRV